MKPPQPPLENTSSEEEDGAKATKRHKAGGTRSIVEEVGVTLLSSRRYLTRARPALSSLILSPPRRAWIPCGILPAMRAREIRRARLRLGLTLAQAAVEIGVSPQTFWRWETGRSRPLRFIAPTLEALVARAADTSATESADSSAP